MNGLDTTTEPVTLASLSAALRALEDRVETLQECVDATEDRLLDRINSIESDLDRISNDMF